MSKKSRVSDCHISVTWTIALWQQCTTYVLFWYYVMAWQKKRKRFIFCVGELVPLHVITNWIIRFSNILSQHSGWLSSPLPLHTMSIFIIIMVSKRKCTTLFKKCSQAWYCNFTLINFQTKNKFRFYLLSTVVDCIWSPFHVFLQDKSGNLQETAESISTFGIHRK